MTKCLYQNWNLSSKSNVYLICEYYEWTISMSIGHRACNETLSAQLADDKIER